MTEERSRNAKVKEDSARQTRSTGESGLARWSRRKTLVNSARESALPAGTEDSEVRQPADADTAAEKTDADMPPIESLHQDSDYAAFLSPKVSEKLRRQALRKLFHLPQFNFRDGLDDYTEDYRNFKPLGDIITANMRYRMERELESLKEGMQTGSSDGHENEKPAEATAASVSSAESVAIDESQDGTEAPITHDAGAPLRNDPSKG
jgi:hypothetical protein